MTGTTLKTLLAIAWLLPLLGFLIEVFGGYWGTRKSKAAAYLAVFCIAAGFVCSATALVVWGNASDWTALASHGHDDHGGHAGEDGHAEPGHAEGDEHGGEQKQTVYSGSFYTLAKFGSLVVSIDYYIDSLTLVMFVMVTFIATCIHVFAIGYMSDELTDDYVDHEVHTSDGGHFHRPGRFYRFFSYLSLFCFSMLGLVLAGNIFQVFVFWELVGICSYLLIGFYVERKSASTAANKAFIMNRVGDFGFLIGLMVIWTSFGTFSFGQTTVDGHENPGLFAMIGRNAEGQWDVDETGKLVHLQDGHGHRLVDEQSETPRTVPYYLLVIAGLGIFAGCIGKSAQFPLQTWLPDAMEGPTPVSALVHSATMVAAGVYLAGRFYPMFAPEVLLTIAYVGCITLFVAATIAVVATDLKKVLAYSTISQLGYMMLGLGVFGWAAGLFHLITHAFFKSLMFLCSGSVIHGCHHEQEMTRMGGLWRKMPITAFTMLVGVIAISGLAIPGSAGVLNAMFSDVGVLNELRDGTPAQVSELIQDEGAEDIAHTLHEAGVGSGKAGDVEHDVAHLREMDEKDFKHAAASISFLPIAFSGFHSKDAIVATALAFTHANPGHYLLFLIPLVTAGITAFYMFRLWFYTFSGKPRDQHLYDHCHESPMVMAAPLLVLSVLAAFVAIGGEGGSLYRMLIHSEPAHLAHGVAQPAVSELSLPGHDAIHEVHATAGTYALIVAFLGTGLAWVLYGAGLVNPAEIRKQMSGLHSFLVNKWHFDELYDAMFVRPMHVVGAWCTAFDRTVLDGTLHRLCRGTVNVSQWDRKFDETVIDGLVNLVGNVTFSIGRSFRVLQTGRLRQYVMFIAVGVLALFVLLFAALPK